MTDIRLDSESLKKLGELHDVTRVLDESGNVKAFLFSPDLQSLLYEWAKTQFPAVESRIPGAAKKYYTTSEAIARLKEIESTFPSHS